MKKMMFASLVLVIILAGCADSSVPSANITVVANDFNYTPNMVTVPHGEEVTITFKNDGQVEHDFVIAKINVTNMTESMEEGMDMAGHDMEGMEFDVHMATMPGGSTTIKFTPQEAGEYEVFCTVEGHKEAGMIGKLVVVDQN
jgi:uncharacterized cupredoxin-like copper-binding protein